MTKWFYLVRLGSGVSVKSLRRKLSDLLALQIYSSEQTMVFWDLDDLWTEEVKHKGSIVPYINIKIYLICQYIFLRSSNLYLHSRVAQYTRTITGRQTGVDP